MHFIRLQNMAMIRMAQKLSDIEWLIWFGMLDLKPEVQTSRVKRPTMRHAMLMY